MIGVEDRTIRLPAEVFYALEAALPPDLRYTPPDLTPFGLVAWFPGVRVTFVADEQMDPWRVLEARTNGMISGLRRILDEGGCPVAVSGARDALDALLRICISQRRPQPDSECRTFAINGHEGTQTVAAQIDPIIERLETTGLLHEAGAVSSEPEPVYPFLPGHLAQLYVMNHPTGEE